jgi:hypothetical protein
MSYLLDRDLSKFDHTAPAPNTDAKSKMAQTSSHILQIDMDTRFKEGKQPFNFNDQIKGTSELQEWYKQFGTSTLQKAATNPKTISQCLEGLGFYKLGQVLQKSTNQKPSLWIVRDIERLKKKQPTELCNEIWRPLNLGQSDAELRTEQQINYSNRPENVQRLFSGNGQLPKESQVSDQRMFKDYFLEMDNFLKSLKYLVQKKKLIKEPWKEIINQIMNNKSRNQKGRRLQNHLRDRLLKAFPHLKDADVKVAIMSEPGADIKLSRIAKKLIPYQFECKNQEKMKTVYQWLPRGISSLEIRRTNRFN